MSAPQKHPRLVGRAAVYVALTTIAIAQPLLQLYGDNLAVFAAAKFEGAKVIWFVAVVVLVPPTLLLLVDVLMSSITRSRTHLVHLALVQLGFCAVVSVLLRSVSVGAWPVDLSLRFALAALATWVYSRAHSLRTWVSSMSVLSLAVTGLFVTSAMAVISPPKAEVVTIAHSVPEPPDGGTPRDKVSVLWIVMDEAPLIPLMNSNGEINAKRFPGFAKLAATSTWYRNATATSAITVRALPAMLSGQWPQNGKDPLLANFPKNLFTLVNGHRSMDAHEVVTALCPREVCSKVSVTGDESVAVANDSELAAERAAEAEAIRLAAMQPRPFMSFLRDAVIVLGHKLLPESLRKKLPSIDEGWGGFDAAPGGGHDGDAENSESNSSSAEQSDNLSDTESGADTETLVDADPNLVEDWKSLGPTTQMPVLHSLIERATRSSKPTLHFAHVLIPHRPWVFTSDGRLSSTRYTDMRPIENEEARRDQYQAYLSQMAVVDTQIGQLTEALRRSGNWDRTMIIVTADHGITFEPGATPREKIDPTRAGTLEDIFRVPMFIKYPDQNIQVIDDCTATSVDLLPTVVSETGIDAGWDFHGSDLRRSCPVRSSRPINWTDGQSVISTGVSQMLERVRYYDRWIRADGDVDDIYRTGVAGPLVGTPVPAGDVVVPEKSLRWRLYRRSEFSRIESTQGGRAVLYAPGELRASRDFSATEEGLLVVDGTVVGTIPELSGLKKGSSIFFNVQPMPRLLLQPPTSVEIWTVDMANPVIPVYKRVVNDA